MQNTAPLRNVAGMTTMGLAVFRKRLVRWGTAMPTKEMGPAKAVTQADSRLDSTISAVRKTLMFTPMLRA